MTTSLLEALNTDRTVADKARFVDYFVGDSLKSWWTEDDHAGTGTKAMEDSIDGGYSITSGATTNNLTHIHFADKRSFANDGYIFIGKLKLNETTNSAVRIGVLESDASVSGMYSGTNTATDSTYFIMRGGSGDVNTSTTIHINTQWNIHKLEGTSTTQLDTINNVLQISRTTGLMTGKIMPTLGVQTLTSATRKGSTNYVECWNT